VKPRVCIVVEAGSVPGRNPLVGPLRAALSRSGIDLVTWDPTADFAIPAAAPDADLYLLKGDHPSILSAAACLHDQGARCLNEFEATAAAADKARTVARLAQAGLPVPQTRVAGERERLAELLASGTKFVKPVRGAHGTGAGPLGPGGAEHAADGPWLVQELVHGPGYDLKTYGVGSHVAVRRMQFSPGVVDAPRVPVESPDPALIRLARAAAGACGLVCFGADFIQSDDGPVIIDVNAFPGYRGVSEAPSWLVDAISEELGVSTSGRRELHAGRYA
jgi:glutathione synthase/RimK-type ligase-like ATP-grasp enzyme